ncbi:hypothetical protein CBR_g23409 [Chara braunii]|uniref:DUF659 domain-containing protein n=1 Tax=Chara braunii TaxID=69332 RepID=A0A388L4F7_CHABU|nr:hypothetical protein CBR_g23409 [Chara braunii]|eukprot:GBG77083.1 hypothetical protein CBR_g23409 [Chara braunii]
MTKYNKEAVKKHFADLGPVGPLNKGNRSRRCKYCDRPVSGTANRARDHFLKSRCHVSRLKGTLPREEFQRRERGRLQALSELGAASALVEEGSSEENEIVPGDVTPECPAAASEPGSGTLLRQATIMNNGVVFATHEETQRSIDDSMTAECIPFNMMRSIYWDRLVKNLMKAPTSFQYAKYEKARTVRVQKIRQRVSARVEELRQQWPTTGCLLQLDGWTDRRARPHINVMISFSKGVIFWRSVCMSRRDKGSVVYYDILRKAIMEIGEDSVVGIVMDNAAVCARDGRMIEVDFPHIFSVSCTAHSIDLILEAFAKIGWVNDVLNRAWEVAKFFTNHSKVRDLLLSSNDSVVAKPGATHIVNSTQRQLFLSATHFVVDDSFWAGVAKVQETSKELLDLLRFVDGQLPTISKVYGRMDCVVEKLRAKECFSDVEKEEFEDIIMCRWNVMTSPLHCATMLLDPEYRTMRPDKDVEVADGFWTWLYSWCPKPKYKEVDEGEEKEEGRSEEEVVAVTSAKRPRGRPRKEAVQLSADTAASPGTADVESEARDDDGSDSSSAEDCGSEEDYDSEAQPLASKRHKQLD